MVHFRLVAPDIHAGDAVGNYCLELVRILNSKGLSTTAYAERHSFGVSDITQFAVDLKPEDIIIVSFSIYDPHLLELSKFKNFKICYFHGITPPKYLKSYDPITANLCELGIKQLNILKKFNRVICNSSETAQTLVGFVDQNNIFILHPITQKILTVPQKKLNKKISGQGINITMLGRMVPHKGAEDAVLLIKLLKDLGVTANVELVGSFGTPNYINHIKQLATQLSVADMVNLHGHVNECRKSELLKNSDFFFSASYHEGFGIPVLEAMGYDLPVVVRDATMPKAIATHCYKYTLVEQAAQIITKLYENKPDISLTKNFEFYNLLFDNHSDELIIEFFKDKIFI